MRKITFLTLVMIFGMSSVSFGKEYLCYPYHYIVDDLSSGGKGEFSIFPTDFIRGKSEIKYMVKTEGNDEKMKSVKQVGEKYYFCEVGKKVQWSMDEGLKYGEGRSMTSEDYRICYTPLNFINGYPNSFDFSLNLRKMIFKLYEQSNGHKIFSKGICEEI